MPACVLSIGLGAFLLFQVQPILARFLLPWFGGGPSVWTACMMTYQCLLLFAYALAYSSVRWLGPRGQISLQVCLIGVSLFCLPPIPSADWKPATSDAAVAQVAMLLLTTVGVPFVTLASTTPLVQSWFQRTHPGRSPYRLYALSNAGSLAALMSYPFVVEPLLSRVTQAWVWTAVFALYAAAILAAARRVWTQAPLAGRVAPAADASDPRAESSATLVTAAALSACSTGLFMAVTDSVCREIAVLPFLWVMPLAIYLASFILCFDRPAWYRRVVFVPPTLLFAGVLCWQPDFESWAVVPLLAFFGIGLFVSCMVCHGELHRQRPPGGHTAFYLAIASGGAVGGIAVALVAPLVLVGRGELPGLACAIGVVLAAILWQESAAVDPAVASKRARHLPNWLIVGSASAVAACGIPVQSAREAEGVLDRSRDFHGTLVVEEVDRGLPELHARLLKHGAITHGAQFVAAERQSMPLLYYGPESGVGLAIAALPEGPRRIGVVGLGAGTLAAYGRPDDRIVFYEIDPAVERMARKWFTYLDRCPAETEIVTGDARLSLESEPDRRFDLLVLDAFSGDSVPVHLLTVEAFETYLRHLGDGGLIAVHVSSRHLDLCRVLVGLTTRSRAHGNPLFLGRVVHPAIGESPSPGIFPSIWILLARDPSSLNRHPLASRCRPIRPSDPSASPVVWSDEHASLMAVLGAVKPY